ncbi:MAG TPA: phage Gp37/Gp68 family protein [Blastocatellia bacterium]|nr:phage Gp37/Gp68 family protein [Blastocatellia bacterium]HMX25567.1 phage Gp37/Gp68 family protein [Blastocatellia bacterium]HMY70300.1 phage Gp37/Gp68 family protein [Blastocatellia bacterium]HMZ18858.1 phage Gp37/Gp68 family protein [Blastocatellia bacterium]HNG31818.1 phage Gp37/Gp68 family protein [Blastocatellia bacterium]
MGQDSKIEWTHHTFNPWRGCTKVSDGCKNCYAETMSKRNPAVLGIWGDNGTRVVAAESYWRQPLKWNREAETAGERRRVFCASLADVLEDRPELIAPRRRLFGVINETFNLDWLLLTKRPENAQHLFDDVWRHFGWDDDLSVMNVWLGTTVENRKAKERIDTLRQIPAAVRFLSCEPLLEDLGEVDLTGIHWVICGGESGTNARAMRPDWARDLRDQCAAAHVPFFFKQWGEWLPGEQENGKTTYRRADNGKAFAVSGNLNRQNFGTHEDVHSGSLITVRVGKKAAGRVLDGQTWDELPRLS